MGIFSRFSFGRDKPKAFDAGKANRRLRMVPTSQEAINTTIRRYGKSVVARSRYLTTNNADASSAKEAFASALVGCGIKPSSLVKDAALKQAIQELFLRWTDESDADGLTDFYGQQAIIAAEMFEAGECFVRIRSRRPEDGLSVPLQLQILPAEMLDLDYNQNIGLSRIECGIEFDAIGKRIAYHFWRSHPGDDQNPNRGERVRVPASEVLHLFRPIRAGQIRGVPHTVSAIVTAAVIDAFEDAMSERMRAAALIVGAVTRPTVDDDEHPLEGEGVDTTTVEGAIGMEPGAVLDFQPGEEFNLHSPPDAGVSYEPFVLRQKMKMAAGYGVTYADMTGDLRQANYGSQRGGLVQFRRRIEAVQHHVMAHQLCRPIWQRFIREAVLIGALPIRPADFLADERAFTAVKWIPPRWDWIDPEKDLKAEKLAVDELFKPRSDVIEGMGYDPEEVDQRIAADQAREEALGLKRPVAPGSQPSAAEGDGEDNPDAPPAEPEDDPEDKAEARLAAAMEANAEANRINAQARLAEANKPPATINVSPSNVTVNADIHPGEPPVINVAPAEVTVESPVVSVTVPGQGGGKETVKVTAWDKDGRIAAFEKTRSE